MSFVWCVIVNVAPGWAAAGPGFVLFGQASVSRGLQRIAARQFANELRISAFFGSALPRRVSLLLPAS